VPCFRFVLSNKPDRYILVPIDPEAVGYLKRTEGDHYEVAFQLQFYDPGYEAGPKEDSSKHVERPMLPVPAPEWWEDYKNGKKKKPSGQRELPTLRVQYNDFKKIDDTALRQMLADYHRCEVATGSAPDVLAVERYFRFPLDASTISGRIDRIDRRPDGTLRLVDYKSGKAMAAAEAEQDLQLALYALACAVEPELAALGTVGEIEYVFPGTLRATRSRVAPRQSHPSLPSAPASTFGS
jgi:hypothetical protein